MPTLRPITNRAEREAYHAFRYRIYADGQQRGFLGKARGSDIDEFDAAALHLGWFEGAELVGCARILRPKQTYDPLHFIRNIVDEELHSAALAMLAHAKRNGETLHEVSRLCLAPEYRSPTNVRQLVLEIIATAHRYGRDHCLFTCDKPHAPFWCRMGFSLVPGFAGFQNPKSEYSSYLFRGNNSELMERHRSELQLIGLA